MEIIKPGTEVWVKGTVRNVNVNEKEVIYCVVFPDYGHINPRDGQELVSFNTNEDNVKQEI